MIETIGGAASGIVAVVVVLGACIFFHELGHFALAKLFGMKVEEFAMGFGRALWSKTSGETAYRINLIPLGGYVRIAGMEPGAEADERGFYRFARWKGGLVLLAGSVMNVVLAALAFIAVILASGMPVFPGKQINIEKVLPDSPAASAGIQSRDQIVSIDGIKHSLLVTNVEADGVGAEVGLGMYDRIYKVDDEQIDLPHQLVGAMIEAKNGNAHKEQPPDDGEASGGEQEAANGPDEGKSAKPTLPVTVLRFNEDGSIENPDGEVVELPLPEDLPEEIKPAEAGPLLERTLDITLSPIGTNESIAYISERPEQKIEVTVLRDGRRRSLTVTPNKEWARVPSTDKSGRMTAAHKAVGRIGVVLSGQRRPASMGEALSEGINRSVGAVVVTAQWLYKMATGEVAPQASGPVGIAAITADRARIGWTAVASVAGLISANLAIINMLPFPPFDGFRIVLLTVEGFIGRRVNEKVELGLTISGVAILVGLFLVITFRDIFNLVLFQTP